MAFTDTKDPREITKFLRTVLSRGSQRGQARLYHYTLIQTAVSIVENHSIWLGSTDRMNDYLEGEFIQSEAGKTLFFTCFSKVEENLAMYKMYAPAPDGVMLSISYADAERLLGKIPKSKNGKQVVYVVRDGKMTDETMEADIYWSEVCYKDLHTDTLRAGTVTNEHIRHPLTMPGLAGYVKLYGWEYEKEVRLCADIEKRLPENERIAIKLPDDIDISVVFGPGFDKTKNKALHSKLKRNGVNTKDSEYDALVDLGGAIPKDSKVAELEAKVTRLQRIIDENDWDGEYDEEEPDDREHEWDWDKGYHELRNGDGQTLKAGNYLDGHLIDGTVYNIILKVCKGPANHDYDYEEDPSEESATINDIKNGDFNYCEYGQYDGMFQISMGYNRIIERGLDFFYVVDKQVKLEGDQIKPTYTNFRTLESFLEEQEPDTLKEIKTGIQKYSETNYAEFDV